MTKYRKNIRTIAALLSVTVAAGTCLTGCAGNNKEAEAATVEVQTVEDTSADDLLEGMDLDEMVYVLAGADGSVNKILVSDWMKDKIGEDSYTTTEVQSELPVSMKISYKLDGQEVEAKDMAGKNGHMVMRIDYTNNQSEQVMIDGKQETIYVPFVMLTGMILDNENCKNITVSNGKIVNDGSRTVVVGFALPGMQENLGIDTKDIEIPSYVEVEADVTDFEMMSTLSLASNDVFNKLDTEKIDSVDDLKASMDELSDATDKLINGSSDLYDGIDLLLEKCGELTDGIDQIADGAGQLNTGAGQLDAGAAKLQSGAGQLQAGAGALIDQGINPLKSGLDILASQNEQLQGGATQVFNSLLNTVYTQLTAGGLAVPQLTIANYPTVLQGVIDSLDASNVTAQVKAAARPQVEEKVRAGYEAQVKEKVTEAAKQQKIEEVTAAKKQEALAGVLQAMGTGMTLEQYEAAVQSGQIPQEQQDQINAQVDALVSPHAAEIEAAVEQGLASEDGQKQIDAIVQGKMAEAETQAAIQQLTDENLETSPEVQAAVTEKLAEANAAAAQVSAAKAQLDSFKKFYDGLNDYTNGVASAAAGAGTLKEKMGDLYSGTGDLVSGTNDLKQGTSDLASGTGDLLAGAKKLQAGGTALVDGVTQLKDGALQLSDGMKEFNEKGIQKLVDLADGDLEKVVDRVRAITDASKSYRSFRNVETNEETNARFMYRTDAIRKED